MPELLKLMQTTLPGGISFEAGVGLLLRQVQTISPFLPSFPAMLMTVEPTELVEGRQSAVLRGGRAVGVESEKADEGGGLSWSSWMDVASSWKARLWFPSSHAGSAENSTGLGLIVVFLAELARGWIIFGRGQVRATVSARYKHGSRGVL